MSSHRHFLPAVLPLLASLLSACGGSSAPAASAPTVLLAESAVSADSAAPADPNAFVPQPNGEGAALTFSASGTVDLSNPFFKPFGNGRTCASCHQQGEGWSIQPLALAARFEASAGTDPVFRLVDGANSPLAASETLDQKRLAYSMLLTKGLIRVGMPVPAGAEFTLEKTDDPYGYASARELSLFRRPLPTTNLKFISSVMWDGRVTLTDPASKDCIAGSVPLLCYATIDSDLLLQSNFAVRGHAEAAADLSETERRAIVDFEKSLFTAQLVSKDAGNLTEAGGRGGPALLAQQDFYFGINDVEAGDYRSGAPFERGAMTMFGAWRNLGDNGNGNPPPPPPPPPRNGNGNPPPPPPPPRGGTPASALNLARASVARGEMIFNTRPFNISGVAGFNDDLRRVSQRATCTSCHSTPNSGSHSVARLFNTGVSDAALRTPDMPLYTLRNPATGAVLETTDPGAALLSGKWSDIGRFKVPGLRGIEARSPYFHNGSASEIEQVVQFYDRRFQIGLSASEIADLSAFLKVL